MGVITTSRGCFERCCSYKKTPLYHSNLGFATLRTRRPTLLRYHTPSEASSRRRCGRASRFLWSRCVYIGRVLAVFLIVGITGWPLHDIVIANIVWCMTYTREVEGGLILPNTCAIVFQQCGQCKWAGGIKGRLIRAQKTRNIRISCKGRITGTVALLLATDKVRFIDSVIAVAGYSRSRLISWRRLLTPPTVLDRCLG